MIVESNFEIPAVDNKMIEKGKKRAGPCKERTLGFEGIMTAGIKKMEKPFQVRSESCNITDVLSENGL